MDARRLIAEAMGTGFLLAGVVGSGIMGAALAGGNDAVALLANAIATGCVLFCIITVLGPVSGAHFNPAVTVAMALTGRIGAAEGAAYVVVQVLGGVVGVVLAHAMFDLSLVQVSQTARSGTGQWIAEAVATLGLISVIFGGLRHAPGAVPTLVALYITGAYWFTASTSFANPAVTFARMWTDTFAGIAPGDAPAFILAQILTAFLFAQAVNTFFAK